MIRLDRSPSGLIRDVHRTFNLVVRREHTVPLPRDELALRLALMGEEFGELVEAMAGMELPKFRTELRDALTILVGYAPGGRDLAHIAQEHADLLAVLYGNTLHYGFDADTALAEVVRSNMTKLDEAGEPLHHPNGKIKKGPNFEPPDPARLLGRRAAS